MLKGLFEQVLKMALELGAMKLGRVALDGSKVKANASKHKAMSYERMQEQEKAIREQVKELLARAEAADAEEDARYGKERAGDELPEELQRRETRLKRIREAKRALEERAREKAKKEGKQGHGGGGSAAESERPVQLYRSRVADHAEQQRRIRASLQPADRGGAGAAVDRGAGRDASGQR